jgi:hypothetical protein
MSAKTKKLIKPQKVITVQTSPVPAKRSIDFYLWGTALIIVCISLIRLRLINVPLERDEGEYAYMGKLVLNSLLPYKDAYNMKLPGTYFMYALIMSIFGKTTAGIHTGFLVMNAATMFVLFVAFRKLYSSSIAFFASCAYGLMALSGSVLGFAAHATHFVSFFVAMAIFFLAKFYQAQSMLFSFLTGLMFGLSFLMKQQAIFFLAFGGLAVLLPSLLKKPIPFATIARQGGVYSFGAVLPYLLVLLLFKSTGAFNKFWFWTIQYAGKYASGLSFTQGQHTFRASFDPMWKEFGFLWLLFFAGLGLVFLTRFSLKQKLIATGFAFFAFLTVCPGFYFRQHYFVSFLPAIGLLAAIGVSSIASFLAPVIKVKNLSFLLPVLFVLCFIAVLAKGSDYYFQSAPEEISKRYYGSNPFVESVEVADFIEQNSIPLDKVAVLGSEPQIYFYSDRLAATGYLYTYPLVENHSYNKQMQEEMIAEVEKVKPKFIVYCNVEFSWLYHAGAPRLIYEWAEQYLKQHYDVVGVADEISSEQTIYKWNEEAKTYIPAGSDFLKVYKRK